MKKGSPEWRKMLARISPFKKGHIPWNKKNKDLIISKSQLEELYLQKGYSVKVCADILGASYKTVWDRMEEFTIPRRDVANGLRKHNKQIQKQLSQEELVKLYINQQLSTKECAEVLNCGINTVNRYLRKYNIPIRNSFECRVGRLNPNWKGGLTKLEHSIRNCLQYKQWQNAVLRRDNWTCWTCHKRGGNLEVHHIVAFKFILDKYNVKDLSSALNIPELWDTTNGITLCTKCHKEKHNGNVYIQSKVSAVL